MVRAVLAVLLASWSVFGVGMSFYGDWDVTLELLPNLRVYRSNLKINYRFAPGWRIESESKFYSDGLRYQNFYVSGRFGDFRVWGKIYFHAQEVRYQRMWVNAEIPAGAGTFRTSFNHWATLADYTSGDRSRFGPWPCVPEVPAVSWEEAWKFMGQEAQVTGVVKGYYYAGYLILNIGKPHPDPNRFQIYIPAANVPAFEDEFGPAFWEMWVGETVCVKGTIKGYRYTSGGPRNGGYSVAEVSITSPSALSLGLCAASPVSPTCPGLTIRWWEAHAYAGQTVYVQGPVVSITGPGTYHGYSGHYRVRIGGGGTVGNRVEVIMPTHPGWTVSTATSYTKEVCVHGKITVIDGVAVILPGDLIHSWEGPCCGRDLPGVGRLPGMFLNWRHTFSWAPFTITVDFSDCCTGFFFRQLSLSATGLPLCCGLFFDASFTFAKSGFEALELILKDLPLFCCGLAADLSFMFTADKKTVSFEPKWRGLRGCLSVYGDALWDGNVWGGLVVYGWRILCWVGDVRLEAGTALDRAKMNAVSPL